MNNRYLFKAKRIDTGEWVKGFYVKTRIGNDTSPSDVIFVPWIENRHEEWGWIKVDPSTICQYSNSGRCTLNEKPIWENDIVTNGYYIGIVRFGLYDTTHFGFYIEWIKHGGMLRKDLVYWIPKIKTIGNIFDNPELLGQEG